MKFLNYLATSIFVMAMTITGHGQVPTIEWLQHTGGAAGYINGSSITTDAAGNIYTTGSFNGTVDFNPGAGTFELTSNNDDGFVTKTDGNGNFVWAIQMGAELEDKGTAIAIDKDENVLVTGTFAGTVDFDPGSGVFELTSFGVYDVFVLKLTSAGTLLFAKQIGGADYDLCEDIKTDAANNIFIVGTFYGVADFDPDNTASFELTPAGPPDIFIAKLDKDGVFEWANGYGNIYSYDDVGSGRSITVDPDGNVIATGEFESADLISTSIFITKLDNDGNLIWDQLIGEGTVHTITSDASGNLYYSGSFEGTVDFNPFGSPVELTTTGNDSFVCKLNAAGEVVWTKAFGLMASNPIDGMALDINGNLFFYGNYFDLLVDVDPGAGVANLHHTTYDEDVLPFILKLNNAGEYVWAQSITNFETEINAITTDNAANIYVTGTFGGTVNFSTGVCLSIKPTATGETDLFVLKLKPTSTPATCFGIIEQPLSGTGCQGSGKTLTAIAAGASRVTYQWQFFNGSVFVDIADQEGGDGENGYEGTQTPFLQVTFDNDSGTEQYRCKVAGESVADVFTDVATITLAPSSEIPNVVANSGCGAGQFMITAYGGADGTYTWYDESQNSIAGQTNGSFTTPLISVPTVFYVSKGSGECQSDLVKVEVNTNACAPVPGLEWVAQPQIISGDADIKKLAVDAAGNIYATGTFYGTVDFDTGSGTTTLTTANPNVSENFLLKLDKDRNVVWVKSLNDTGFSLGIHLSLDNQSSIYVSGGFRGTVDFDPGASVFSMTSTGNLDMFVSRFDTNGNFVWARRVGGTTTSAYISPQSIASDGNGVYITGGFNATIDFDPNAGTYSLSSAGSVFFSDIYLLKLNPSGDLSWAYRMGRTSATDGGRGIKVDASGNVYSVGTFSGTVDFDPGTGSTTLTGAGGTDTYVHKLTNAGVFQWVRGISSAGVELPYALALDASGNPHVTGTFNQITDFDPEGGVTQLNPSQGIIFTVKLTSNGALAWAKNYGATFAAVPNDMTTDASGNVLTIGYSEGTSSYNPDFDPGSGVYLLKSNINGDAFVSMLDVNGNFVWAYNMASTGLSYYNTEGLSIATYTDGSIYTAGSTAHTSDLDPGNCTFPVFGNGSGGTFIQKIKPGIKALCFNLEPVATTVCTGATVTLSAAATGTTNITYQWQKLNTITSSFENIANTGNYSGANTPDLVINTNGDFGAGDYRCYVTGDLAPDKFSRAVTLTIGSSSAPSTTNASHCGQGSVVLTASGGTNGQYRWYDSATGGTAITGEVNGSYTTPSVNVTTSYYVAINYGNCESNRAEIKAIINPTPSAPTTTGSSICGSGSVSLKAAGGAAGQYRWYDVATGGTASTASTNDTYTTSITTSTTYFVAINNSLCESPRTSVTATANSIPIQPTITSSEQITNGTISICTTPVMLSAPTGYPSYLWSSGQTTQQITSGVGKYTVTVTDNNGCTSVSSDEVQIITTTSCNNGAPVVTPSLVTTEVEGTVDVNLLSMISDPDNNLDAASLKIISQPVSGAIATLNDNGILTIDYKNISFSGTDRFTIEICDFLSVCTQQQLTVEVIGEIVVYNGISPNGDGKNDFLFFQYIDILEATKSNNVSICNRWGDVVWESDDYNNSTVVFNGTTKSGNELSSGTYFYKITFTSGKKAETGFFTLKR